MSKRKSTKPRLKTDQEPYESDVEWASWFVSQANNFALEAYRNPDIDPALRDEAAKKILKARDAFLLRKRGSKGRVSDITLLFLERVAEDTAEQAMMVYQGEKMDRRRVHPKRLAEIAKDVMVDFLVKALGMPEKEADFHRLSIGTRGYNRFRLKNDLHRILTGHKTLEGLKTAMRRAR